MTDALCAAVTEATESQGQDKPAPDIPPAGQLLWEWFWELDAARGGNGFALNPIDFQTIAAWARLTGIAPTPRDVLMLRRMDDARRAVLHERDEKAKAPPPLTPDAMRGFRRSKSK